jgi:hypothetical protein
MRVRIRIELDLGDDFTDPDDFTGMTEEGYIALLDVLGRFGENVDVKSLDL